MRPSHGDNTTLSLRVTVGGRPDPSLLRAAITARVQGRPWPAGTEGDVAEVVAKAVAAATGHGVLHHGVAHRGEQQP